MRIDAHQHFWKYDADEYGWIQPEWLIRRDYLPHDLEPELRGCGLDGCVAVQARQTLAETEFLLQLAEQSPMIRGVVGWVDLRSEHIGNELAHFADHPKFVGVRHVVQDEPDDNFMLGPDFQRGIAQLAQFNLTYDILIFPKQLPAAIELVKKFPLQPFVLDHIAKPQIKAGVMEPWGQHVRELSKYPHVFCKVSGMVTEADWRGWKQADFQPYLETVLEAFGADRLMYGSDWPVALLAGSYRRVYDLALDFIGPMGDVVAGKFFGVNAIKFYGLETE